MDEARNSLTERAEASRELDDMMSACQISSLSGEGIELLLEQIETQLTAHDHILNVRVTPDAFTARAWLHENGQVLDESSGKNGIFLMKVRLSESDAGRFRAKNARLVQ